MAREITGHRGNGLNELVTVVAIDESGVSGANCHYAIDVAGQRTEIRFPCEESPLGLTNEALLAIVQDRLEGFQRGKFACPENAGALIFVHDALRLLKERTAARVARGVKGTHQQ